MENVTVIKIKVMAQCKKCGVKVSCGCQLTNGLCSSCLLKEAQARLVTPIKFDKNVNTTKTS